MGKSTKMGVSLLAAAALFQAAGQASADEQSKNGAAQETDRVIVTFEQGASISAVQGTQAQVLNTASANQLMTVEVPDGADVDAYMEELGSEAGVANVEPDYLSSTTEAPNDPYYSLQYHHGMIGSEQAWTRTTGSSDVLVAVLDNGFDLDHPDLQEQIVGSYATGFNMSEDDHGTHVAGVIGATQNNGTYGTGVAPHAGILAVDVFEGELAYSSHIIEGIYYAVDAGADIINLSLGNYYYSETYQKAIRYAHENGVLVVAASGNDYTDKAHYPSGYEHAIAVGSTDRNDKFSNFSNFGAAQDITAPGTGIWSTISGGNFAPMSGTSMASPVVAGVAALLKANEPDLTNVEIEQRLYDTAVDLGAFGKDHYFGHGRLDAEAALMIFDIARPTVGPVYETSPSITGNLEQALDEAVITVENENGEIASQDGFEGAGDFTVKIPPQAAGSVLTLTIKDRYGNESEALEVHVLEAPAPDATERISGTDRYKTAVAISQQGWQSADTVVLATGGNFPDALAGGPLAYLEDAPILLTRTGELVRETKQEIERLGAEKAVILGSTGAVSQNVEAQLKAMDLSVERIGGKTRFDTAALIAEKMGARRAVVANGLNFPDVLSVSSYAARNGVPILLTRSDRLPEETQSALESYTSTYVIGSTGVVSDEVFGSLPDPERFGGKTRYETGYEVATRLALGTEKAYIATGLNFPDALTGSVLAAKNNAPILLVRPDEIPDATDEQLPAYSGFSIFGGTGAVNERVKISLDRVLGN